MVTGDTHYTYLLIMKNQLKISRISGPLDHPDPTKTAKEFPFTIDVYPWPPGAVSAQVLVALLVFLKRPSCAKVHWSWLTRHRQQPTAAGF